ncbi:MAG: sulfite exporter TauE/SafE family protein [Candidatus Omnitrophica bacterium]|nr:sulfite exporter TauE/SafE family protein [Candidatus Omnitrophota bacterium]
MKIYFDLFITGVALSWGPCLSFCAPVLLPYIAGTQKGWLGGLKATVVFSLARIIPYIILSVISVSIGQYLIKRFYQTQESLIIQLCTSVFIVFLGLMIIIGRAPHFNFCAAFLKKFNSGNGLWQMAVLGFLIGSAPCVPLFGVLLYITFNAQSLSQGALFGLVFGIGTLVSPLMLIGPLAAGLPQILKDRPAVYMMFSRICGLILMYLGINMLIAVLRII